MQRIALVVFDGARNFDIAVVNDVWGLDRAARGVPRFELRPCGVGRAPVQLGHGISLTPDRTLAWLDRADLVVIPGFEGTSRELPEPILGALRRAHARGIPTAALCAGAFVLAAAGLLDGRRAVTHWNLAGELARRYPRIRVEPGALFIHDDGLWTSAGAAAGIDLCLHLVRQAHGAEVAATVARAMVTAPFRTGSQAQFIDAPVPVTNRDHDALATVRQHALRHLDKPLSVADLAALAGMSERSFIRHFAATTGASPLRWLLTQRVAAAQRLLEQTDAGMDDIAHRTGFGSAVTMRQHFVRHLSVAPRDYRRAFHGHV